MKLFRFCWDYGRGGEVEGLFIAEQDTVDFIIGQNIYFGEILGKHSDVYGILNKEDVEVVSDDREKVEWLKSLTGYTMAGHNPIVSWIEHEVWEEPDFSEWPDSLLALAKEVEPYYFEDRDDQ